MLSVVEDVKLISSRTYTGSKLKTRNKAWKLKKLSEFLSTVSVPKNPNLVTLCGESLAFEGKVLKQTFRYGARIDSYNDNDEEFRSLLIKYPHPLKFLEIDGVVRREGKSLLCERKGKVFLAAHNIRFNGKCMNGAPLYFDFDSTNWFGEDLFEQLRDFIAVFPLITLTVITDGGRNKPKWKNKFEYWNPEKIRNFVKRETGCESLGMSDSYQNENSPFTMRTISFLNNKLVEPADHKIKETENFSYAETFKRKADDFTRQMMREACKAGIPSLQISSTFGVDIATIRAYKASLHR